MWEFQTRDDDPEYVVLGYDTEINYEKISTASIHMHRGVSLVASHPGHGLFLRQMGGYRRRSIFACAEGYDWKRPCIILQENQNMADYTQDRGVRIRPCRMCNGWRPSIHRYGNGNTYI